MESEGQKAINVQVAVRCRCYSTSFLPWIILKLVRPTNTEERTNNHPTVVQCDSEARQVKVNYGPMAKKISNTFSFDSVLEIKVA